MSWWQLVAVSLSYALVLVVLFAGVIVGGLLVARDALVDDYPPTIRERHGPQGARGKRAAGVMGALNAVIFVAVPIVGMVDLHGRADGGLGFWRAFVFGALVWLALVLFDLVILDWWLFCTVQPRFMVLPGTEGMAEYRDYGFHWRVLVPRPVPWPLLTIFGYGAVVGAVSVVVEVLR
ncbi:hypothetical protein [Streptomyces sp. NEAU-YJ-81]|uniref:hypothetical protein n=1 Tax=Streptomyces sp. NEAU-YJ-81 TaxID=2820288 RepID=UPI001ABCA8DA|nr:hypothetical protein [Streptomyces sp. NEAU-YJ-81]MBO3673879.1 hypothetical protein [Streptomyces sp. NEAU-YJ-81]